MARPVTATVVILLVNDCFNYIFLVVCKPIWQDLLGMEKVDVPQIANTAMMWRTFLYPFNLKMQAPVTENHP